MTRRSATATEVKGYGFFLNAFEVIGAKVRILYEFSKPVLVRDSLRAQCVRRTRIVILLGYVIPSAF